VYTLISPIFSYKLYSVATPGHPEPFPLENHARIVALTPDSQRVSFYSITDFLYYSSTTELILSLILIKGSYPSSKASLLYGRSSSALWLLWRANSYKIATRISTSVEATNDIWVRAKRPRTPHNIYAVISFYEALGICITAPRAHIGLFGHTQQPRRRKISVADFLWLLSRP